MAKFISLFAGVGGFDLGMEQAGHECVAQVEWDKNAAGVLKYRWPNVPLFCDVSKVSADDLPDADFITYGFPCQDLSVAGKREGLDGKRSGLFYEATRLIRELRTRGCRLEYAIAENVAGLFSADDGLAFARCIRELLDSGACETGWRLLDSQYFGVAQRRKRVFIVSDFGGESVDEILAITESLPGHPPPSREAGKGTAGDATKGVGEGGDVVGSLAARDYKGVGNQYFNEGKVIAQGEQKETYCLQGGGETSQSSQGSGVNKDVAFTLNGLDKHGVVSWNGDTTPKASEDVSVTLRSQQGGEGVGVAFTASDRSNKAAWEGDISGTINCQMNSESSNLQMGVRENLTVRRLTPIECERLQGFPDNWTSEKMELTLEGNEWKATGKVVKQADGPRYKAMGNAVTVNVAEWIGKQIGKVIL
jgi:DNA (cytosine-5)-methyltransferase 1